MFLSQKNRAVVAIIIATSISSQPVLAHRSGSESTRRTTKDISLLKPAQAEALYRHLIEIHWTPKTGLFRSFPDSADLKLSQQASTYEQAAMGLLCIRFGDLERAKQLLRFFKTAWDAEPRQVGLRNGAHGLANFYNADFGSEGIEKTIHAGPNAWAGLFAARLANQTHDAEALQWALDVQYWIANVLPHDRGGVAMGLRDDPQGAPWSRIISTENNLSYYAFLTELLRNPRIAASIRTSITQERDRVEQWLVTVAYEASRGRMLRGINPLGPDRMQALDTVTWLISAIGPARLAARGIDPEQLMKQAEKTFEVRVGNAYGVDPTDRQEADSTYADLRSHPEQVNRPEAHGHRVIWYEGLGQYILAWSALSAYAEQKGHTTEANRYRQKARTLTSHFDQAALPHYDGSAFPYATPGLFFRYGWGAPQESAKGPAASLIAGVWRCFAGLGMDPLAGQDIPGIEPIAVTLAHDFKIAKRNPAILFGTSEDMTTEAWKALRDSDWTHAIAQAEATIQEWSPAALYLQKKKMKEVGTLVEYSGQSSERKNIFSYWALNDVAAAYFILGQAQDHERNYVKASHAFQQVVNHYSLAQVWDPQGWFWSPVEAITNDYVLKDKSHYGWVLPQIVAEGSKMGKRAF